MGTLAAVLEVFPGTNIWEDTAVDLGELPTTLKRTFVPGSVIPAIYTTILFPLRAATALMLPLEAVAR